MNIQAIVRILVPNPRLDILLRMAKTLVRDAPAQQNDFIMAELVRLIAHIAMVDAALSQRIRATSPAQLARELEFDRAVDSLWVFLRKYLDLYGQTFAHPGLALLSDERKKQIHYDELRARAELAAKLHEKLFGVDGTNFTRKSMVSQVEAMAALLRVIKEDGLDQDIATVLDDAMVPVLVISQEQYEDIVNDRLRRNSRVLDDFRELRGQLRWRVERYKAAVESLYNEDEPATEAIVEQALRPLLMVSTLMSRGSKTGIDDELDAELVANEFDLDLEAEEVVDEISDEVAE